MHKKLAYNAYWTPEKEREYYEEETGKREAMEKCVEYLNILLVEIDSLVDWEIYPDMRCAVATAKGEECEENE